MEGYELLHVIGSGSFGKVFMGRNKITGETVALKKISKGGRQEREIRSLRQECEIQKNLHHPNIIQMLDSFETDDSVVVVTEYAQGDLCKLMIREGRLPLCKVQLIACHLVSALYFLHSHRILHRDIKPQNILIGWDGQAKLCDFGFARTMGINTYMLTSIKGTPLYMAPEIVQEKPYDHNADLWSLGCILYELLVGTPPFFTTSLFQLVRKIKNDEINWPDQLLLTEESSEFLKGLLEKDPQKRLTWPGLLTHKFVKDGLNIDKNVKVEEGALTKALSPSQEMAKERQRQNLQRKLAGYSKLLVKTAKKLEEAQKELKRCSEESQGGRLVGLPSPSPTTTTTPQVIGVPPQDPLKISPNFPPQQQREGGRNVRGMMEKLNINERAHFKPIRQANYDKNRNQGTSKDHDEEDEDDDEASSCETLTSSSGSELEDTDDEEDDDDGKTVIVIDGEKKRKGKSGRVGFLDNKSGEECESSRVGGGGGAGGTGGGGGGLLWKSGALFTLHSFGSEDKPINSEEWIYFLTSTMKEVGENPKALCEKHFLTMLVAPLRNHLAEPEVIEKIALLLSSPFTLDKVILEEQQPELMITLQGLYLDTKVLPNLLYSCKLIVRRRKVEVQTKFERGSGGNGGGGGPSFLSLEEIPKILTMEDLEGLAKCAGLITYLVYVDEDFVAQLCDSVQVLQAFGILQLFLKLDKMRSEVTSNTIAVLCHILRIFPGNKSIVEEILLDDDDETRKNFKNQKKLDEEDDDEDDSGDNRELWRLLNHPNPTIQGPSLRLFVYLCLNSERVRKEIFVKNKSKIWKILKRASISPQPELRKTAEFVLQSLNYKSTGSSGSAEFRENSGECAKLSRNSNSDLPENIDVGRSSGNEEDRFHKSVTTASRRTTGEEEVDDGLCDENSGMIKMTMTMMIGDNASR